MTTSTPISARRAVMAALAALPLGCSAEDLHGRAVDYPADYLETVEKARKERDDSTEPALRARVPDIGRYTTVYHTTEQPQKGAILAIILISYIMIVLDILVVLTGLPKIHTQLGFTDANVA